MTDFTVHVSTALFLPCRDVEMIKDFKQFRPWTRLMDKLEE
jgi:hypothetical protein